MINKVLEEEKFNIKDYFNTINVLDKGFVDLHDGMVLDPKIKIVNSARVSYNKVVNELSDKDMKLIQFLRDHGHYSTFRHSYFTFRVKAPLCVFRQAWKYQIGNTWTENDDLTGVGNIEIPETNWNEMCIEEDTLITVSKWGGKQLIPIKIIYERWCNDKEIVKKYSIRCFDDESKKLVSGKISDVMNRGIQEVYRITLSDNKYIDCTKSHRILTENGYQTVQDCLNPNKLKSGIVTFTPNVKIATNGTFIAGNGKYRNFEWIKQHRDNQTPLVEMANEAGCSYDTIRKWITKFNLQQQYRWKSGNIPWNRGLKYKSGKTHSESAKAKFRKLQSGSNCNFWKGGLVDFRRTVTAWTQRKTAILCKEKDYTCENCNIRGAKFQSHHIVPVSENHDLAFNVSNLALLCVRCHRYIHKFKKIKKFQLNKHVEIPEDFIIAERKFGVKFVKVSNVTYIGERQCYDIEIAGKNKNFVANGIIIHNSGRYSELQPEFYIPKIFRRQSTVNKQGSDGQIDSVKYTSLVPLSNCVGDPRIPFEESCMNSYNQYKNLIDQGVGKEQARMLLPQNIYSECIWTISLQGVLYFLDQRLKKDAQWEIRQYAIAIANLLLPMFQSLELIKINDN